ncbi:hypothetical protein ATY41_02300 [Leifsonia xyli subsp. xyli]|uniref:Uncharacterized protein n=1 Tax=Leifsonia xyli subsp. xyli TaxID=59736 RepID=A0A1E2SLD9_LEIXY|nr:hypothetical protein [Leifsonia xyli]ODA90474.1 hypothetical protein ATY41_02300 [Leifsonia xyli subsp. xyli]
MTQRTPKITLQAGIIVTAVGAVVLILSGDIVPNMVVFTEPSGQALLGIISILASTIRFIAIPLGCALIAAGLIMRYLRHLHDHPLRAPRHRNRAIAAQYGFVRKDRC